LQGCVLLFEQIVVAEHTLFGGRARDDHGGEIRVEVPHGGGHTGQRRLGDHHLGVAVADQEGDLGWGHPEVDRNRDGTELVDRQDGLDELGAVSIRINTRSPKPTPVGSTRPRVP
jgi:hypothetical protein